MISKGGLIKSGAAIAGLAYAFHVFVRQQTAGRKRETRPPHSKDHEGTASKAFIRVETTVTPLHIAAEQGNIDTVQTLMTTGCAKRTVNTAGPGGNTALHLASQAGHSEVARLLCQYGADVNASNSLPSGNTPLHLAASKGLVRTVRALIAEGANVFALNAAGEAPADLCPKGLAGRITRNYLNVICAHHYPKFTPTQKSAI